MEGHSLNRKNKNRVRQYLRRTLGHLEAHKDIPEATKRRERQSRSIQLESIQRPRRHDEHTEIRWKGGQKRCQVETKTTKPRGRRENWWEGCKVPDCFKGLSVHSIKVMCKRLVHRTARGRRYDVVSNRNKFHCLHHQVWTKVNVRKRSQTRSYNNNRRRSST